MKKQVFSQDIIKKIVNVQEKHNSVLRGLLEMEKMNVDMFNKILTMLIFLIIWIGINSIFILLK